MRTILLFNSATFNPLFTVLGLVLGAAGIGLGYGAVKLLNQPSPRPSGRVINTVVGGLVLGGALLMLGLAGLCVMWVAG